MTVARVMPSICSDRLAQTRDFYVDLFGFQVVFDSDWFVNLATPGHPFNEIGIWRRDHERLPEAFRRAPQGVVLCIGVDDVDAVYADAVRRGCPVVEPPHDLPYGQRRCLLADPNGLLVDVSTPSRPASS